MRIPAVTTWTAAAVTTVAISGVAFALFFNNAPAGKDAGSTEVGGVTVTAPADIDDSEPADPRRTARESSSTSSSAAANTTRTADIATADTATNVEAPAAQAPVTSVAPSGGSKPGGQPSEPRQPGRPGGSSPASPLEVKGSVAGLYPGATKHLPLTFENTNNFAVDIVDMTITPSSSGSCASTNLELPPTWTTKRIAANAEETVKVPVSLSDSAGTECAGAIFALTYNGKAVKA